MCIAGSGYPLATSGPSVPLSLRTAGNFGEQKFLFRVNKLVAPYQELRQRLFYRAAKLLPPEILMLVVSSLKNRSVSGA